VGTTRSYRLVAIDHVQLAIPAGPAAEDAAEEFYSELLGLDRVPKPPELAVRGGCWFTNGDVTLHVGVEGEFRPARKAHPALVVDDLGALLRVLEEAGVATLRSEDVPGRPQFYVDDPFGNRIELAPGHQADDLL
jgi:catechol 2,3-dioxygenase-like lactoylglutathione lyase family enzyme